jgi:hypothetical protein
VDPVALRRIEVVNPVGGRAGHPGKVAVAERELVSARAAVEAVQACAAEQGVLPFSP